MYTNRHLKLNAKYVQVILFEIDCTIFYTNLRELFFSWTYLVNSGKFMDNCWISCQILADMKKVYDDLIIINLYVFISTIWKRCNSIPFWLIIQFDLSIFYYSSNQLIFFKKNERISLVFRTVAITDFFL